MKKFTFLLVALVAFALQINAQDEKDHSRSAIFNDLPAGYEQVGETSIYYDIDYRRAAGAGYQYGISILGEINGQYYSSTYEYGGGGAGFIAALKVDNNNATYLNALEGTTSNGVTMTARIEAQGDVAAKIVYSLKNNNSQAVTVSAGVWGDVMIGNNDYAPLSCLKNNNGETYGIKMKYNNDDGAPLLCALFGEGITGTTPADDYWFGYYYTNYYANEICGDYSAGSYYMQENGNYDSGMGFCWKNRTIEAGETLELSYVISVGEVDFEEPIVPGEDLFTYNVEAYDIEAWNDLGTAHPAHIWGYYEHPYGQEAYIEYQVDGGEWMRIPTPLVSGEEYNLDFQMYFDQENLTLHTLNLRFTLGLGDYNDLEGLEWVDVRSYTVEGLIPTFPYDGRPKVFEVIVNGESVIVGADGEFEEPGVYTVIVAEGSCEDNTIGRLWITFEIENAVGVQEISVVNEDNGAWYTIDGKRIVAPVERGIYIHNGKKFIVK